MIEIKGTSRPSNFVHITGMREGVSMEIEMAMMGGKQGSSVVDGEKNMAGRFLGTD